MTQNPSQPGKRQMSIRLQSSGGFAGIVPPPEEMPEASEEMIALVDQMERMLLETRTSSDDATLENAASQFADGMEYILEIIDGEETRSHTIQESAAPDSLIELLDEIRALLLAQ